MRKYLIESIFIHRRHGVRQLKSVVLIHNFEILEGEGEISRGRTGSVIV